MGKKSNTKPNLPWWVLWDKVYGAYIRMSDSLTYPQRNHLFYTDDRSLMSGQDNVTVFFTIDAYPVTLPMDFHNLIRSVVQGQTQVSFVSFNAPTRIDWSSPEIRNRRRNYARISKESASKEIDSFNYQENIGEISRQQHIADSVAYLSDITTARDNGEAIRQLFDSQAYMVVSGKRGKDFDNDLKRIQSCCASLDLTITRVTRNLPDFIKAFSPTSIASSTIRSTVGNYTLPDEILSRFATYDQGMIGSAGVYMGTDLYSDYPILKVFKRSDTDAENVAILAETGWGKSFTAKTVLFQLATLPRVRSTIFDFEGTEYGPFATFFAARDNVVVLNMAEGQGSYFDPVAVITTGDSSVDSLASNLFGLAKNYTLSVVKTLIGEQVLRDKAWASAILDEAVANVYSSVGALESDPSTWGNTKNLTLFDVYEFVKASHPSLLLDSDHRKVNEEYRLASDLVIYRLRRYFEPPERGGVMSHVFRHKVDLQEIVQAKMVVCSFGMESRSTEQVDPVQLALSQISAANISHVRSLFCKKEGMFNLKIWEELQRWAEFPGAESILKVAVTGGRKMGDINFLISNEPRLFLGIGAKLDIFSNLTSFMIGGISDATVRADLAKALSVEYLSEDLDAMAEHAGNLENFNSLDASDAEVRSRYHRSFLMKLDKSVATIGKISLPVEIAKSDLFRTGSSVKTVQPTQPVPNSDLTWD